MLKQITILSVVLSVIIMTSCYKGHGLSPPGNISGIQGRITFTGTWPDSTREVWVAVLKNYPQGITDPTLLLAFVIENLVIYEQIPNFIDHYDYQLKLEPGDYAWVLVAWFPDITAWLLGVKELGAHYRNPDQQEVPSSIHVITDVMHEGINIIADFSNLNRETPFFKEGKEQ